MRWYTSCAAMLQELETVATVGGEIFGLFSTKPDKIPSQTMAGAPGPDDAGAWTLHPILDTTFGAWSLCPTANQSACPGLYTTTPWLQNGLF